MKFNIKTKKDMIVSKEQLNNIVVEVLTIQNNLNKKYGLNLETVFKFEAK